MSRAQRIDTLIGKKIRPINRIKLPSGRHTNPRVFTIGDEKFVLKSSSKGKGLSYEQANELAKSVRIYNAQLRNSGVNVSEVALVRAVPEKLGSRNYYVMSLEKFINRRNASQVIASAPPKRAIATFRQVAEEVYKAVTTMQLSENKSGVLIDSKPKNYVKGKDGKMYYIDFYTPKLFDEEIRLHPYYSELHSRSRTELQTRFQDKRALFQILLTHTVADRVELREAFEKELIDFLRTKGENRLVSYLQGVIRRDYRVTKLVKESDLASIPRRAK